MYYGRFLVVVYLDEIWALTYNQNIYTSIIGWSQRCVRLSEGRCNLDVGKLAGFHWYIWKFISIEFGGICPCCIRISVRLCSISSVLIAKYFDILKIWWGKALVQHPLARLIHKSPITIQNIFIEYPTVWFLLPQFRNIYPKQLIKVCWNGMANKHGISCFFSQTQAHYSFIDFVYSCRLFLFSLSNANIFFIRFKRIFFRFGFVCIVHAESMWDYSFTKFKCSVNRPIEQQYTSWNCFQID